MSRLTSDLPLDERVRNGADLLDLLARAGRVPADWRTFVDLDTLNMRNGTLCLLGQVGRRILTDSEDDIVDGFYDWGRQYIGPQIIEDESFGFYLHWSDVDPTWTELGGAWKAYLTPTEPAEVPTP